MTILKTVKLLPIIVIFATSLISCSSSDSQQDIAKVDADSSLTNMNNGKLEKVQEIFYTIPSPMEMASLLKKAGTSYNAKNLNNVNNVVKYTSAKKQALNLGIYGADLSYASIFNQNQESIIYLSCAKQLADQLGVTNAFNNETMDRIETNIENRDSLLEIISDAFYTIDGYLKENNRQNISALVITGGWIEGLYLATKISSESKSAPEELKKRIADQKYSLGDLLLLIDSYPADEGLADIRKDLSALQDIYAQIELYRESGDVTTDEATGTVVIGGSSSSNMTDEQLNLIAAKVKEIRSSYIN
jgi:hypothetical protein